MKISIESHTTRKLFRYSLNSPLLSSFSPKTLNPKTSFADLFPNSLIQVPSARHSSSESSLFFFPLPCLPIKNRHQLNSSSWVLARCKVELRFRYSLCCFSSAPPSKSCIASSNGISSPVTVREIVDILRNDEEDVEFRLSKLHSRLCKHVITDVFELLNCCRVSGLRFFEWIRANNPHLHKNSYLCSLIIDNLGRLNDYGAMNALLKMFMAEKICLSYNAFSFLLNDPSHKQSTKRVVELLNGVGGGGSFCSSSISALIDMFCKMHMFEMAKYVMIITESNASFYRLLVREMCRSGLVEDAHSIIKEMRNAKCAPDAKVYNYILGSLWKNDRMGEACALLDEMRENGVPSDSITFEILINSACSLGAMDEVCRLLDEMSRKGLEPRTSTHAFVIKSLFAAGNYEAAKKYVVDSSVVYKTSSNMMYSLLASLYCRKGDAVGAGNTLVEMMENNLKPDFRIFVKIVTQFRRRGKANLARDLEIRHSKFVSKLV